MGIASLGALARSKDELIGVRSDEVRGKKGANVDVCAILTPINVIPLRKPGISNL